MTRESRRGSRAAPFTRRRLLCGAAAAATVGSAWPAAARSYNFSPVNLYGLELTAGHWNPILQYVSRRSGVNLQLKLGRTSGDTTAYVLAGEVDFVFSNHLFSPGRERLGWSVFGRRNVPAVRGQLVVPPESALTAPEQLAGRPVAFPGPEAFVIYKVSIAQLEARGIVVEPVFSGNNDASMVQLLSGRVAAAATHSLLSAGWMQREHRHLRIIWESGPFVDLPLMVSRRVPEADRRSVRDAFLQMADEPRGRSVLEAASQLVKLPRETRFIPAAESDYQAYRDFFRTAPAHLL